MTDRIAEGLLIAVRDAGRRAIANPRDYEGACVPDVGRQRFA